MLIAVNTRFLIKDRLEGIGWFTFENLKRITKSHPEHEFLFIFDRKYDEEFIFSSNITPVVKGLPARHPYLWKLWFDYSLPKVFKKYKPDLFLSTDGFLSLNTNVKSLPVIHDINFHHYPKDLPKNVAAYYNKYFPKYAAKASRIATVSEYSKNDIAQSFGISKEKIDVIYNGSNSLYSPLTAEEKLVAKKKFSNNSEYFVFVGALNPRKNVDRLLQAYDKYRMLPESNLKLLIVGEKMFKTGSIEETYNKMKHKSEVVFTGRLSPEDLRFVMGSATALTFVPYFEGFGIPIVEAMYSDVPVITSNVTSMPEVGGDAVLLVDPFSVESIYNSLLQISKDEKLRTSLIEKGRMQRQKFSWDKSAERLWQSIEKAIEEK
ncbi:MAG: glycosyltransferase family 4 protein [Bacteroidales bacterium]|nr:glycosyltransferase family 4 protein [Bacteroidales bacterium]